MSDSGNCDYRVATERDGVSFCRHTHVHVPYQLVTSEICRSCTQRTTKCNPREVPTAPLLLPDAANTDGSYNYISTEQLLSDVRHLASNLPPDLTGVAGIPRSGLIPASLIASLLHLPLYEVHRELGLREIGHGLRLKQKSTARKLLVIDDSVFSGYAMSTARRMLSGQSGVTFLFAAVYPRPERAGSLDFYGRLCPTPHLFEWNLFNCVQTQHFAFDMDGILCEDWPGGSEEGQSYQEFLDNARPRWLPRRSAIPLIVTARLEKHRESTLRWLKRHGVRVKRLVMGPWKSTTERRRNYNPRGFKGREYGSSNCTLFIESDERQARAIHLESGKPVLHPASGRVFQ